MSAELEAGRELDALVVERLGLPLEPPCPRYHSVDEAEYDSQLGWDGWCYTCGKMIADVEPQAKRYSTDIAAAWEVVEKLMGANDVEVYRLHSIPPEPTEWACRIGNAIDGPCEFASADTAPLAICRAAIRATALKPDSVAPEPSPTTRDGE